MVEKGSRKTWLDVARVIAIIAISSNHAIHRAFIEIVGELNLSLNIFRGSVQVFSRLGVPLFVMISGALLLNKKMETDSDIKRFYQHNLLGILITTEIWYFIMFWFRTLGHANDFLNHGFGYTFGRLMGTMLFLNQETLDSMWYMPMILCIYLLIPWINLAVHKVKAGYVAIPVVVAVLSSMIIPNINDYISLRGGNGQIEFALQTANLFSMYMIYLLLGYYICNGLLAGIPKVVLIIVGGCSFALSCVYQIIRFEVYNVGDIKYNFIFIAVAAIVLFELLRRSSNKHRNLSIQYLSRISFGIYFVHIVIMSVLYKLPIMAGFGYISKFFLYEILSVSLSVVCIAITSKIQLCRKYLFMIK